MRKALYAGISAFALALAFGGSSAWANPFEESVNASLSCSDVTNCASDNSGNSGNAVTNANQVKNVTNRGTITQFRNDFTFSKVTVITADQDLDQTVSRNHVTINANGGSGGRANGGSDNEVEAEDNDHDGKIFNSGNGSNDGGIGGGGGGGGTVFAGNLSSSVTNSAGLIQVTQSSLAGGAQAGANFAAFAINSFNTR